MRFDDLTIDENPELFRTYIHSIDRNGRRCNFPDHMHDMSLLLPGQPLPSSGSSATFQYGPGTYVKYGIARSSVVGEVEKTGGVLMDRPR